MRLLLTAAILLLAGCGYAPHVNPPLQLVGSPAEAERAVTVHVKREGGWATQNLCCGSMIPAIQTNDWLVVQKTAWRDALLGRQVVYRPDWNGGHQVVHRLVYGNAKDGFIASGDNNPRSESFERVTAERYDGEVVTIYRAK